MPKDYLIRACDASHTVRAFACISTDLVQEGCDIHGCSPISGMALGRLLTASILMGDTLKSDKDTLSLQIKGDNEIKSLIAVVDSHGHTSGNISNPLALESHSVGEAIGKGSLTIIRDLRMKEPYVSTVPLQTGEIGDDITFFYASSEQTPSSMGLAVIYDRETLRIKVAGGFLIQLMPDCPEPYIITLEENLSWMGNITKILEEKGTAEHLLEKVMDGLDVEILEKKDIGYQCNCSLERMEKALKSLPKDELKSIAEDDKPINITCDFCKKKYTFLKEDIDKLLNE